MTQLKSGYLLEDWKTSNATSIKALFMPGINSRSASAYERDLRDPVGLPGGHSPVTQSGSFCSYIQSTNTSNTSVSISSIGMTPWSDSLKCPERAPRKYSERYTRIFLCSVYFFCAAPTLTMIMSDRAISLCWISVGIARGHSNLCFLPGRVAALVSLSYSCLPC
jgi:hypothetical protein